MVASDSFAEFLREQLAPMGRVTMRRMFGKTGVFCNGLMFGMVTDDTLFVRVDDHNKAVFEEAESVAPLNYVKKGRTIDLSFWRVPERLFDEPAELVRWAGAALGAARRGGSRPGGSGQRQTSSPQSQHSPWGNLVDPLRDAGSRWREATILKKGSQRKQGAGKAPRKAARSSMIDRPAGSGRDGRQPLAETICNRLLCRAWAAIAAMTTMPPTKLAPFGAHSNLYIYPLTKASSESSTVTGICVLFFSISV
jgi:DNA transformation protein